MKEHLRVIEVKYHSLIRQQIADQLLFQPCVETRNRKPLRPPAAFSAQWEIRFGPENRFRVPSDVDEAKHQVQILAIGEIDRDRLLVAGERVEI